MLHTTFDLLSGRSGTTCITRSACCKSLSAIALLKSCCTATSCCSLGLQDQATRAFEQRLKAWDSEVSTVEQQKKALTKGGSQASAVVRQIASWQASLPQAEQAAVQLPKYVISFPVLKTRGASAMNGFADKGTAKKKVKEDVLQADLQRTQAKNPVQVFASLTMELHLKCHELWLKYRTSSKSSCEKN